MHFKTKMKMSYNVISGMLSGSAEKRSIRLLSESYILLLSFVEVLLPLKMATSTPPHITGEKGSQSF